MSPDRRRALLDAQEFLTELESLSGIRCIIAGGFVRDCILDQPFRDIDLYIPYMGHGFSRVYRTVTGDEYNHEHETDPRSDAYEHQSIGSQCEVTVLPVLSKRYPRLFAGHPLNLIGLNGGADCVGTDIVSRFNFGICQAWLSKSASGLSDEFRYDAKHKVITLLRTDWGLEGSLRQYEKLHQKYHWPMRRWPADVSRI